MLMAVTVILEQSSVVLNIIECMNTIAIIIILLFMNDVWKC